MKTKELELYLHIPFCKRKCHYCDFLSFPTTKESIDAYVKQLICEIKAWKDIGRDYKVSTIFIGGGTPSMLEGSSILAISNAIRETFECTKDLEFSMEMNPGTICQSKLFKYREAGVNRISFGLQSTVDEELKILGRIHTYEEFLDSFKMARAAGFGNINIDLMSAIPGQTIASYERTLHRVCNLHPEHISTYSLIIEEGTDFYENDYILSILPSEDEDVKMYELTEQLLQEHGYHRYELSNFSKENYECKHNCGYWKGTSYLGFGLGASSLFEGRRFENTRDMNTYLRTSDWFLPWKEADMLSRKEEMEEFMFLGLRMMEGISSQDFYERFQVPLDEAYGEAIQKLIKEGLLEKEQEQIRLTKRGYFISNQVFVEFISSEKTPTSTSGEIEEFCFSGSPISD